MRTRSGAGWGKLYRDIARAFAGVKLNGYESKMLWAIVYKTIAFTKEEDKIPRSQFVSLTGINKRHINRTINSLLKKGIIIRKCNIYGVQRDFTKWEKTPNQVYTEKKHLIREETTPNQGEKTPNQADSRDPSQENYQEKAFSKPITQKQREDLIKHFKKLQEDLKKVPDRKK